MDGAGGPLLTPGGAALAGWGGGCGGWGVLPPAAFAAWGLMDGGLW